MTGSSGVNVSATNDVITIQGPNLTNYVDLTGAQTITGSKTFNAITNVNGILNVTNSQDQMCD